ncbi:Hsp20/alpha crystallin family protein [Caulobacter sp. NIBR1757]|uniref:Hsp20/alpha crystallin family protein n=1 Tax=Caulobacter sp. NIBR1757 TaxID=3016000 RepID=UPI0022EFF1EE|nr:Hsp20/alpha crystallin family protein [Caulobacter sp. NIBR1757]WGM39343.1 hypothetical protein AMEJIAPC_02261 [Caulobacter sp. NIBR1757]
MTRQDPKALLPTLADQTAHFFAPLQKEIDRVVTEFARGVGGNDAFLPSPDMDLVEKPDGVELTVELPGLKPEDISITLEDGVLTVCGEKHGETDDNRKGYRVIERRFGAFSRSVRLPGGVIADQIKADLKEGVLTITAPRQADQASRKVPIGEAKA